MTSAARSATVVDLESFRRRRQARVAPPVVWVPVVVWVPCWL